MAGHPAALDHASAFREAFLLVAVGQRDTRVVATSGRGEQEGIDGSELDRRDLARGHSRHCAHRVIGHRARTVRGRLDEGEKSSA